ncbi:hypothetical protein BDR03DRAFT_1009912 [Suillus americanus]|nr:hypothetical protein BDR03DRAFT_1009912 [Suillus americanus]
MKGLLSLVLVSIALLQTAAAVPAAPLRRGIVITRTPEIEAKDLEERSFIRYASGDSVYHTSDATDDDSEDEGNYLALVLFSSVVLTRTIKHAILDDPEEMGIILPQVVTMGTATRHAIKRAWLTVSNTKKNRVGSELKAMMREGVSEMAGLGTSLRRLQVYSLGPGTGDDALTEFEDTSAPRVG